MLLIINNFGEFLIFQIKNSKNDKIILNKKDKVVSDGKKLCRSFSVYFPNTVSDFQVPNTHEDIIDIRSNYDPV